MLRWVCMYLEQDLVEIEKLEADGSWWPSAGPTVACLNLLMTKPTVARASTMHSLGP